VAGLSRSEDGLPDQGVVGRGPDQPPGRVVEGFFEVGEEEVRQGRSDKGVTQGAWMPIYVERFFPSLVPGKLEDALRGFPNGDRVESMAGLLERRCHTCPLQMHPWLAVIVVRCRIYPRAVHVLQLLTVLFDLLSGNKLLGEIPLVRLPHTVRKRKCIVVIFQDILARLRPDVLTIALPVLSRETFSEGDFGVGERENHRAAFHGGRLAEEMVALARSIVEHIPLPAQGVYPFARAAGKAPSAEGHLPVAAGRALAYLEVESELIEGWLQETFELERPALIHEIVVAG